ncbi:MAG: VCBS repeat-containing protein [Planctomycetota bacterium]
MALPRPPFLAPGALLVWALAGSAAAQVRLEDRHSMVPVDDDPTESIALADLDGDGDLDLVWGNGGTQNRLLLNDGNGSFLSTDGNLPPDSNATCALVAADFDGDGDLDLFAGNGFGGQPNRLYLGFGGGFFLDATSTHLPVDSDGTEDAAAGDLDGDGDLDLILGNDDEVLGQQNRIYLNDGSGVFSDFTATNFPVDAEKTEGLALADFDGDNDLDVVFVNDTGQNRLYLNDGLGVFTDATANLPVDAALDSETVAVADFDGDGDEDIFVGNSVLADKQNRLYLNDGSALFTDGTATHLPVDTDDTEGLSVGDVDGDGDLDVLAVSFFQPDRLYLNDGAGTFTFAPEGALPAYFLASTKARLGDVDGDGDLDAVVAYSSFENRLWLNDGAGTFREPTRHFPTAYLATRAAALADVDADGDLDALLGDSSGLDTLYLNNGAGVMSDASAQMPTAVSLSYSLAVGDLDGDVDLDVYVGADGQDAILTNDGTGSFTGAVVLGSPELSADVALLDVEGDGDLDVWTATLGQNHLLANDGLGAFTDATASIPVDAAESRAVVVGDVDGDTDLDVLVGNGLTAGAANFLYLGDGLGAFVDGSVALPADADQTGALALGDVDNDGDLDLVAGNGATRGEANRLYLGDGLGGFTESIGALPTDADETCSLVLTDLDDDGDLDLIAGNGHTLPGPNRTALNDGLGLFTDAPDALPARSHLTSALVAGDLDGEGDVDLLVGELFGQSRVLLNVERHIAWRGEPRIGTTITMDLNGPPTELWFVAYSIGTTGFELDPYGVLFLDPLSTVVLASGILTSSGEIAATFPIPDNPILIGLDLPWQAVLGNALQLSNLERTVFTDL